MIPAPRNMQIGMLGEDIAAKYLLNKGFKVVDRNFRRKCGEIDIIAQKRGVLYFFEVKSVSCEINSEVSNYVSRETSTHRPEDNIHAAKLKRLERTIQMYLLDKYFEDVPEWQFCAIAVKIDVRAKTAKIKLIENIIL